MKRIICKKIYDTETSQLIHKRTYSYYGDPAGYEELLMCTQEGMYFVYSRGGAESPFPVEQIKRIGKARIEEWMHGR